MPTLQPNPETPSPVPEWEGSRAGYEQLPFRILPIIHQAVDTFHHDLPELLKEHPGEWVAYHGDRRLRFARSSTELYQDCFRQGYERHQFLVRKIVPQLTEISWGPHEIG